MEVIIMIEELISLEEEFAKNQVYLREAFYLDR